MSEYLPMLLLPLVASGVVLAEPQPGIGPFSTAVSIPISIRNEMDFALEGGRAYLESAQGADGLWDAGAAERSSLPAFAFLEPPQAGLEPSEALRKGVAAALSRLTQRTPFVQSGDALRTMAEDALVVAASLSVFEADAVLPEGADPAVLRAARTRLAAAVPPTEARTAAWLRRTVLALLPGRDGAGEMELRERSDGGQEPSVRDVALAGLEQTGRGGAGEAAVQAHLRWVRKHEPLFRGGGEASMPEDLYYLCAFLDSVSPAELAKAEIPATWRTMMAQRLVASARSAGEGLRWGSAGDEVRQTLFAVATLVAM